MLYSSAQIVARCTCQIRQCTPDNKTSNIISSSCPRVFNYNINAEVCFQTLSICHNVKDDEYVYYLVLV